MRSRFFAAQGNLTQGSWLHVCRGADRGQFLWAEADGFQVNPMRHSGKYAGCAQLIGGYALSALFPECLQIAKKLYSSGNCTPLPEFYLECHWPGIGVPAAHILDEIGLVRLLPPGMSVRPVRTVLQGPQRTYHTACSSGGYTGGWCGSGRPPL